MWYTFYNLWQLGIIHPPSYSLLLLVSRKTPPYGLTWIQIFWAFSWVYRIQLSLVNDVNATIFSTVRLQASPSRSRRQCYVRLAVYQVQVILNLFGALSIAIRIARADSRKPTCVSLRRRLRKPLASHLTAACITFATFDSGHPLHTDCYQFTNPWGMDGQVCRARPGIWTRARLTRGAVKPDGAWRKLLNPFGYTQTAERTCCWIHLS
jgi:hypothetical protein